MFLSAQLWLNAWSAVRDNDCGSFCQQKQDVTQPFSSLTLYMHNLGENVQLALRDPAVKSDTGPLTTGNKRDLIKKTCPVIWAGRWVLEWVCDQL